jgi:TonB-dependent receptor
MTGVLTREAFCFLLTAVLGAGVSISSAVAQDASTEKGAIAGVVVDKKNGKSLPGANVSIKGTTTGTTTDLKGRFRLSGIEPGTYKILFSFVGFQDKTVTGVKVKPDETTNLDVTLSEKTAQLDEVVVEAEAARDTEAGLLKDRAEAAGVSDAISAEAIGQAGAGSAAGAMKKVTGASVVGGKYAVIRGLGGRYSNTLLNGVQIPSSNPDRNSIALDLFPSEALQSVVTQKTFTPDQPGNFSGGLVNIRTKSFPTELSVSFSASASVNTSTHFQDDFLTQNGGDLDFLGIDDGARDIPGRVRNGGEVPSESEARDSEAALGELDEMTKSFDNNMAPVQESAPINQSYSFTLGNQSDVLGNPLGYVLSVSYDRSASFYEGGSTGRYDAPAPGESPPPTLLLDDSRGTEEVSWGTTANLNYKLAKNQELGADLLFTNIGTQESRLQAGQWPDENPTGSPSQLVNRTVSFTERRLASGQLRGEHLLKDLSDIKVKWTAAYSETNQEEPDERFFPSQTKVSSTGDTTFIARASGFPDPTRNWRSLEQTTVNGRLDFTLPFDQWGGQEAELKVGGAYKRDERTFSEQLFTLPPQDLSFNDVNGNPEDFFSDENVGFIGGSPDKPIFGAILKESIEDQNDYVGERDVAAAYAMIRLPLTTRLEATFGARIENTLQTVELSGSSEAETGRIDETDVLPSLNLKYELNDGMNLRAAASRTLARPTFQEFGPFSLFDTSVFDFVQGNPDLNRTLITNVDLRWEWFPGAGEIIAASVFYKDMNDPIESTIIGSNGQQSWRNVPDGDVYGLELEVRTALDVIHPDLQYVTLGANGSLIESRVDVPDVELADFEKGTDQTRQLQGQSPYTINLDVTYDNPDSGTTTGLYFNVYGERLTDVGRFGVPNTFEQPFAQLDFNFSQRILDHWTVKTSVENLLGDEFEQTVEGTDGLTYQSYERGRTISLGFSYAI